MVQAVWKGVVLAESNACEIVERNYYFPPNSVNHEYLIESTAHTVCFRKGRASYYDIKVNDELNQKAAWYYPQPKPRAEHIKNHIAFRKGVKIIK